MNEEPTLAKMTPGRDIMEGEEKFKTLFEKASDGIYLMNTDRIIFMLNESFARMHGYSVQEMTNIKLDTIGTPESYQQSSERIKRILNGETLKFEVNHFHKKGHIISLDVVSSQIIIGNNKYIVAFHRDINELKNSESALRESEKKYKELFEANPDGITIFSINANDNTVSFLDMNENSAKMVGYSKEEMLKMNPYDFEINLTKEKIENRINELTIRGIATFNSIFRHKNGQDIPVEIKVSLINYFHQPVLLNIIRDISDRKRAEEKLLESERFLKETQTIARLGTYILDFTSNKWSGSEILNNILGVDPDFDKSLRGWASIIHPDWEKIMTDYFIQGLKSNKTKIDREFKIIRQNDKSERWVHGIGNFTFNDNNQPMTMVGTIRDITDKKQAEEKLKNKMDELVLLNEELEKYAYSNRALEQFSFVASHNLQEPLRTVSNYIKIFEEDYSGQIDSNAQKYLQIINDATKRMTILLNSLLEFSRLGRNIRLTETDCYKVITDVIADLQSLIISSNAIIEITEMPVLNLYETEIRQLFQNLITNAIKFRMKDIQPIIRISSEKSDEKWKFSVSDNGIGIEPAYFNRIFDIFQRLHTEDEYEGSGIGLSYCKKIVQLHQGEIWVESTIGQGATFHFTIASLEYEQ